MADLPSISGLMAHPVRYSAMHFFLARRPTFDRPRRRRRCYQPDWRHSARRCHRLLQPRGQGLPGRQDDRVVAKAEEHNRRTHESDRPLSQRHPGGTPGEGGRVCQRRRRCHRRHRQRWGDWAYVGGHRWARGCGQASCQQRRSQY
jgi:hypothetical protein